MFPFKIVSIQKMLIFYFFLVSIVFFGIYSYMQKINNIFLFKNSIYFNLPTLFFSSTIYLFHTSYTFGDFLQFLFFLMILYYSFNKNLVLVYIIFLLAILNRVQSFYYLLFVFFIFMIKKIHFFFQK